MTKKINGEAAAIPEAPDPTKQTILTGAVVPLTDVVAEHGVLFHHPELPPFKLMFSIDLETKSIQHTFVIVEKERPEVNQFIVDLVTAMVAKPGIITARKPNIIMPGEEA